MPKPQVMKFGDKYLLNNKSKLKLVTTLLLINNKVEIYHIKGTGFITTEGVN